MVDFPPHLAKPFQTGIHVAKARPPPCDAGLSFSDHKGFRDRYPVVWAVAAGGAADIAGLEVGDLVTKVGCRRI